MTERTPITPYPLRMPDDLRPLLEAAAKKNGRSLNAEILARLERSFDPLDDADKMLAAINFIAAETAKHGTSVSVTFSRDGITVIPSNHDIERPNRADPPQPRKRASSKKNP